MGTRTRSRVELGPGGSSCRNGGTNSHASVVAKTETCVDYVGSGDHYDFTVEVTSKTGGRCNGGSSGCGVGTIGWFHDYMLDHYRGAVFGHQVISGDLGSIAYATKMAARTTPSRPYVDTVVNALQLPELALLLRAKGNSFIRNRARENLAYQFGVKPIISDLLKIANFADQVKNRVRELERLKSGRGLRRTISLGGLDSFEVNTSLGSLTVQSVHRLITSPSGQYVTKLDIGGHARWKPGIDIRRLDPGNMSAVARKAVLGLTFDFSSAWELIPWTWLIDWGTTIGDYLKANRNIVPAVLSEISITRHTRTTLRRVTNPSSVGQTTSPFEFIKDSKSRFRTVIAPVAHFPFLSGNQMGILASLAIVKG